MKWILPLALLVSFEFIADIFAKEWSLKRGFVLAAAALGMYLVANTFWLFALKNGAGVARGAVLFSIASAILAVILGLVIYKEPVSKLESIGLVLGFIAVTLILWEE